MAQLLRKLFKTDLRLQPIKYATLCNAPVQLQCFIRYHNQKVPSTNDDQKGWKYEHKLYLNTIKDLVKKERNLKIAANRKVIAVLCKTFKMDEHKCKKIVKQKYFETCSVDHITTIAHFLKEINVSSDHLIKAPWLLSLDKEELIPKLTQLKGPHLFKNNIDGLGFTICSQTLIDKYNTKFGIEKDVFDGHQNRIYYIAHKLNLPMDFFTIKLIHAWRILHLQRDRIDAVIKMLLEFNILPEEIVNDAWVFMHSTSIDKMRERLSIMREATGENDIPLKLWVCRCTDSDFERYLGVQKKFQTNRNLAQILEEDLDLSFDECTEFISKGSLHRRRPRSIEHKIRVYKEAGIGVDFLRDAPGVFRCSEKLVLERWKILQERGIASSSNNLTMNEKRFKKYISEHSMLMEGEV